MKTIQTVLRRAVTEAFDRKKIDDHRRRQYFISGVLWVFNRSLSTPVIAANK